MTQAHPVNSSWIQELRFDDETGRTTVLLKTGHSYQYTMKQAVFTEWLNADSPGEFYRTRIQGTYERI